MIGIYIWIPFVGTFLGAACVLFMTGELKPLVQKSLLGFASGVMVAASVWSLLIPSLEMSEEMGRLSFIPAAVGFALGIAFLLILDRIIPHLHLNSDEPEGIKAHLKKTTMLVLAVTLHNIPEGMAVGVVFAGFMTGSGNITLAGALALAIGIAIQNFPEGAIISLPLRSEGTGKGKAFRADSCNYTHCSSIHSDSDSAVSVIVCSRRHDLCGNRRTAAGGIHRQPFEYCNHMVFSRISADDDTGCGTGIENPG